jgi:hypothetical protein
MQPSTTSIGDIIQRYPSPSLTVDVVVFSVLQDCLQVLLIQRGKEPYRGSWALPGGFVEMGESLDDAAASCGRTGLATPIEQLYTWRAGATARPCGGVYFAWLRDAAAWYTQ